MTNIHEVSDLEIDALRGRPLAGFGVDERFRWAVNRQTKRPGDKAYSLLGLFDECVNQSMEKERITLCFTCASALKDRKGTPAFCRRTTRLC
jgi:hypothetical protein